MPIYAYRCQACSHELEALQKISDAPLEECPQCHQNALKKQVTAAAFRLSGSGWYETDFKSGDKKNLTEKDQDNSAKKDDSAKGDKKQDAGKSSEKTSGSKKESSSSGSKAEKPASSPKTTKE